MEYTLDLLFIDILLVMLTYIYIMLTILIPVQLKKRDVISKFAARKMVHLLAGLSILFTPFYTCPYFAILVAGSLTLVTFFATKDSKIKKLKELYDTIGEEAEDSLKHRKFLQGPFNYCLSILILISIFVILAPHQLYFPIAGILIMIIADTLASVVGKRWGRIKIKLPWTGTRTVEGSLTMFLFSFIVSFGSFWFFGFFNTLTQVPLTWEIIVIYSLATAFLATIIEILSPSTFDDLTVPICSVCLMYLLVCLL